MANGEFDHERELAAAAQREATLRARLARAEETLHAIGSGEVDALVVATPEGERVFTLRGADEPYRIMLEQMSQGAASVSADRIVLYANRRLAQMLQTPLPTLIGSPIDRFIAADQQPALGDLLAAADDDSEPESGRKGEFAFAAGDGSRLDVQVSFTPLPASDGAAWCMIVSDITDRKRAEEELRLRAELLDLAHDAVIVRDPADGRVTFWNREAQAIYGYSEAEAIGSVTHELLATVFPESRNAVDEALARDGRWDGELRHTCKDGREIVVSSRQALQRGADGRPLAIIELNSDITERKQAESSLAQAQARLRAIFDHIPAGLALWDLDGRYLIVNEYMARSLNMTAAELSGRDPAEHDDPETWARIRAEDELMRSTRRLVSQEFQLAHVDGTDHTYHVVRYPILDEHEEVAAFGSFSLDITDRKRAEQELGYARSLLERTEQISKTGGWEYEVASGTLTWTDEVYRIYGIEKTSGPTELAPAIAAYDPESAPLIQAAFARLVSEGEPYDLELGLIRADGERIWVRTIGRPVIEDGRVVRVGGHISDITERHHSERALRQARDELERAQRIAILGSFSSDVRLEEMTWSAELFRIFGRDPAHGPPRAAELHAWIDPADLAAARAAFAAAATSEQPSELDVRVRGRESAERILHVIVHRDPDRPGYCSGTAQDVTRVRATERALREQSERAESASRAKSDFLARMSHELRTPLNSIIGFSQLLELDGLEQRQSENISYVLKAGKHLLELINEVLELTKIESGQTTISPEPVPLADAVADAVALVTPLARQNQVTLDIDTDGLAHDGHVHADRQRLQQVLLNILSNAIKYNHAGGTVHVSFAVIEGGRVRITIADTGLGIAAEQLPKLFQPFERLGAEVTQVEGTGLGLALSQGLIEAMGGTIEVDSQLGTGTTVTIDLAGAQRPTGIQPPDDDHELHLGESQSSRQTILYVEDNLSNLTLVQRILERYPALNLIPAMQATIGLDLARQHHPKLIILDLHLPDMPGTELLTRLKADRSTRDIPIVVLTADASQRQAERVQRLDAAAYLTKPLDVPRFLQVITDTLKASD